MLSSNHWLRGTKTYTHPYSTKHWLPLTILQKATQARESILLRQETGVPAEISYPWNSSHMQSLLKWEAEIMTLAWFFKEYSLDWCLLFFLFFKWSPIQVPPHPTELNFTGQTRTSARHILLAAFPTVVNNLWFLLFRSIDFHVHCETIFCLSQSQWVPLRNAI